jgi:hypothetical protein
MLLAISSDVTFSPKKSAGLAGALIESGHKITGIDNFRTGSLINIDNLIMDNNK